MLAANAVTRGVVSILNDMAWFTCRFPARAQIRNGLSLEDWP
ncbi:hypothetical protein BIFGAL_02630 [Bifidobacterium gallicum DSM 20093 = LMG 11596]|uniref:Uncharacterized protein n=1 Tax=Bifidobacterium gallicum DSM 20093 = LMG 11596 TaxID=561180 RepID=D1NS74_9BIFI|nr:hypothetical protein BIFGAL_02630 [Bifidobacterium gallicum DSM 20093 = LMG 11596]